MIYTCTLNPALDKIGQVDDVQLNKINRLTRMQTAAGGKGILVSRGIKALNHDSTAVCFLGGSSGNLVEMLLRREEMHYHTINILGNTRTNLKIIGENGITESNEPGPFVLSDEVEALYDYFRSSLEYRSILVISGSIPKGCGRDVYVNLIKIAKENDAIVFLDTDYDNMIPTLPAHPNVVKIRSKTLGRFFNVDTTLTEEEIEKYGREFIDQYCDMICVSTEKDGIYLVTKNKMMHCLPMDLDMKCRIGVGDAFVAGFVVGLDNGMYDEEILRLAGASYAATSQRANGLVRDAEEVYQFMDQIQIVTK